MGLNSAPKSKAEIERDDVKEISNIAHGVGDVHSATLYHLARQQLTKHELYEKARKLEPKVVVAILEREKQRAATPLKLAPREGATQLQMFDERDADFEHPRSLEMDENRPPLDRTVDDSRAN